MPGKRTSPPRLAGSPIDDGNQSWRRELLLATLQAAVPVEIGKVTEASTDHLVRQRDRCQAATHRAGVAKREAVAIREAAGSRELTGPEQADVDRLSSEAADLYRLVGELPGGLLGAFGDHLLYGGRNAGKVLEVLAVSLGHMAHSPGGAGFAGLHWCAGPHRYGTTGPTPCDWEGGA